MDRPMAMNRSSLQNFDNFDQNFGIVNDNSQNASDLSGEIITDSDKYPSRIPGRNQIAQKKKVLECPHTDKRYYAKGMCVNCYHRRGRTKKAWKCAHKNKMHYSKGLCKFCYLASYYKSRTSGQPMEDNPEEASHLSEPDTL